MNDSHSLYNVSTTGQVTNDGGPKQSIFYYGPDESLETYKDNGSHVPAFDDEIHFSDPDLERQAREACGDNNECVFDVWQTGRVEIGLSWKTEVEEMIQNAADLSK